jgi:hypothetical protein
MAGTMLKMVSEKNAGIAMNSSTEGKQSVSAVEVNDLKWHSPSSSLLIG